MEFTGTEAETGEAEQQTAGQHGDQHEAMQCKASLRLEAIPNKPDQDIENKCEYGVERTRKSLKNRQVKHTGKVNTGNQSKQQKIKRDRNKNPKQDSSVNNGATLTPAISVISRRQEITQPDQLSKQQNRNLRLLPEPGNKKDGSDTNQQSMLTKEQGQQHGRRSQIEG